jgi:PilZ domain
MEEHMLLARSRLDKGQGLLEDDRRNEPRSSAEGTIEVSLDAPEIRLTGELIDVSHTGFRVAHKYAALRSGQTVSFRHASGSGRARVVWNRVLNDCVESGFVTLPD